MLNDRRYETYYSKIDKASLNIPPAEANDNNVYDTIDDTHTIIIGCSRSRRHNCIDMLTLMQSDKNIINSEDVDGGNTHEE